MKPGKRRKGLPPFVALPRIMLRSKEWRNGLTSSEKILYIHLKHKYIGHNNGDLCLHYSEVIDFMSSATIAKAFKGLREKRWIEETAHIGGKYRFELRYRLTGICDESVNSFKR
jgi:hypothetical protein